MQAMHAVSPLKLGREDQKAHSGMGIAAEALFKRLQLAASSFATSGHSVVLVGHSLGAGVVALLAWLLRERCVNSQNALCSKAGLFTTSQFGSREFHLAPCC